MFFVLLNNTSREITPMSKIFFMAMTMDQIKLRSVHFHECAPARSEKTKSSWCLVALMLLSFLNRVLALPTLKISPPIMTNRFLGFGDIWSIALDWRKYIGYF